MPLSWNEIKQRAVTFSKEWENASNEEAEAKPFLVDFFNTLGISSKRVATFEHRVKKLNDADGYIDLLWKGMILIEMKSRGKNLDKAFQQAREYLHGLKDFEIPKFIMVSDFNIIRLYDLEQDSLTEFNLSDFVSNVHHFGHLIGYQKNVYSEQNPANIKAAELMGKLHDQLEEIGYTGHPLEVYLVRLLFCLFAEDTTIFNKYQFQEYITQRTGEDGSDLASRLQELFQVLNTPADKRLKTLDEQLGDFPYVNGRLFEEVLPLAGFNSAMRESLLACTRIDWSKISPAIFGSMFQSVMNPIERRNLGAHYTSEANILKVIKPLIFDELKDEFDRSKSSRPKLLDFHKKLSTLKFLDPACGCGNFLVITYRELRLLELDVLRALRKSGQAVLDVSDIIWVDVDQFYGIEYEEFPARIAEVAMWLIDHQMNMEISNEFGQYFIRLPLKKAAKIAHADALDVEWNDVVSKNELSHIIGNPPFIGSKLMKQNQRDQIIKLFDSVEGAGTLDYVCGWYVKAARYIQNSKIKVGFVSTNSIVQGEQVSTLWNHLFHKFNVKINFAHRTFRWGNEARGNAAVYCVIIGFATFDTATKSIYEYENVKGEPHLITVKNINGYLIDAKSVFFSKRRSPISQVPEISFGSMPNDGGNFLFTDEEKAEFVRKEPSSEIFFRPLISAHEFLNGHNRWCLWLKDASPSEIRKSKLVSERVDNVKKLRENSTRLATKKLAAYPTLFGEDRQPKSNYVLIPRHSSENRKYIPIGFFDSTSIASDSCLFVEGATLYHFGVLMSSIHMAWVRAICGRIKSDFRYSNELVYNNYPWPENPPQKHVLAIEKAAQSVLDARKLYPTSSLADLYDPLTMPVELLKAHQALDKAVDVAYRPQPFPTDANRLEFLFDLYEKYTAGLFRVDKKSKKIAIKK